MEGNRKLDYVEKFRQRAERGKRLTASKDYGGSLPCFPPPDIKTPRSVPRSLEPPGITLSTESDSGFLSVPCVPYMRRTHSDCAADGKSLADLEAVGAQRGGRSPSRVHKVWSSLRNLVDSCEGSSHCTSPPSSPPYEGPVCSLEVRPCASAPNSRSSSPKRKKRTPRPFQAHASVPPIGSTHDATLRSRNTPNLYVKNVNKRPTNLQLSHKAQRSQTDSLDLGDEWQRVRHFVITPKGVVNCGDSLRSKSCCSLGGSCGDVSRNDSIASLLSQHSQDGLPVTYTVIIVGAPGVGKTTLAQQFLTSECLVEKEVDCGKSGSELG